MYKMNTFDLIHLVFTTPTQPNRNINFKLGFEMKRTMHTKTSLKMSGKTKLSIKGKVKNMRLSTCVMNE